MPTKKKPTRRPRPSSSPKVKPAKRTKAKRGGYRLIVVANRLPVRRVTTKEGVRFEPSPGGLVSAMLPVLARRSGVWIGWAGDAGRAPRELPSMSLKLASVSISSREMEGFYHGFSNSTLWPLHHDCIRPPNFDARWWEPYVQINRRYALAAAKAARAHDALWIHDYHLQLVPQFLRAAKPHARIGFFLHIPFPPEELFAWLPRRREIIEGLLGADVLGFQTASDARNFSRAARRFTDAEGTDTELTFEGRTIQTRSFPISIDFKEFEDLALLPEVRERAREIRGKFGESRKLILSVDRLDYTKGIDQRLLAFENLLKQKRVSADQCVLVQIAVPSRELVQEYEEIRSRVERIVGRINGEFGEPGRVAVHYFRRSLPREELVAFYRAADVMLVTPFRDGMNLVAKEYVATRTENDGALVLSEFAGAARELRQAIQVNPHDVENMAAGISQALALTRDQARRRMVVLRTVVRRHDVNFWARQFIRAIVR